MCCTEEKCSESVWHNPPPYWSPSSSRLRIVTWATWTKPNIDKAIQTRLTLEASTVVVEQKDIYWMTSFWEIPILWEDPIKTCLISINLGAIHIFSTATLITFKVFKMELGRQPQTQIRFEHSDSEEGRDGGKQEECMEAGSKLKREQ